MFIRHCLAACLFACSLSAQATTVTLPSDGSWQGFDVSDAIGPGDGLGWIDIDGQALGFSVSVGQGFTGRLTVVDTVFAGDVFSVSANGALLGNTSAAVNSYPDGVVVDPAAALANASYSRGVFQLRAGSYTITGRLASSALDGLGSPINATSGALNLTVSAVPEASTLAMLLAGLGLIVGVSPLLRRRAR